MYKDMRGDPDIPQGPTSGKTIVTIFGQDFTSFARPRIDGGIGVQPQGCKGTDESPCYTVCNFPFIHAIQGSTFYYRCINLKRTADQAGYNPDAYWCAVGESRTFANQYGNCNPLVSRWRDNNQGGKIVTNLECRFGEIHVPASIIDNATITCRSPSISPLPGVKVPVSVTMNRKDYSRLMEFT
jgi:hypothetical protein